MTERLIVDVGMHRGDDTAFYLAKGFEVLAVEANPELAEAGRRRFATEIDQGRLTLREVAIAEALGKVTFFAGGQDGWGSLSKERAGSSLNVALTEFTVEACSFESLLAGLSPYYVKVDIEGADLLCVNAVERLAEPPRYFSFECDLLRPDETVAGLHSLARAGFSRFKLVNQALNPSLVCPDPPLEGRYVDTGFTHEMSGLFGEESPGPWLDLDSLIARFRRVALQQTTRAEYAESGRVLGVPLGRFHPVLKAAYNAGPVRSLRSRWASFRGAEVGGWFDVHAAR